MQGTYDDDIKRMERRGQDRAVVVAGDLAPSESTELLQRDPPERQQRSVLPGERPHLPRHHQPDAEPAHTQTPRAAAPRRERLRLHHPLPPGRPACMELQSYVGGEEEEEEEEKGKEELSTVSQEQQEVVSDGEWHSVQLFMTAPWSRRSSWSLVLDEDAEEASTSAAPGGGSLNFLRRGWTSSWGAWAPWRWGLVGCLGPVELGGVALPYFSSSQVKQPRQQEEQFVRTSATPPRPGCAGGAVCEPNPCLNGGLCQDLFHLHRCVCPDGWAGRRCSLFADTCASGPASTAIAA
ncbi:Protein crumbs 1 [Merluccius polli]|uniref:Protein crumbs 1 n=1 Tax=Merluccius polli TaxID=89951 RepID=A0AA47PCP4_MERPO|nr:Protein crumbs 1 [Merluccius polli]